MQIFPQFKKRANMFIGTLSMVLINGQVALGAEPSPFLPFPDSSGGYVRTADYGKRMCLAPEGVYVQNSEIFSSFGTDNLSINRSKEVDDSSGYWTVVLQTDDKNVEILTIPQARIRWEPYKDLESMLYAEYAKMICVSLFKITRRERCRSENQPCYVVDEIQIEE